MKRVSLLSAALALILLPMPVVVSAQDGGVDTTGANTRAAKRAREAKTQGATKATPMFPNATRVEPAPKGSRELARQVDALFKLQEAKENDEAIAKADAVLADAKANAFDKSTAGYIAGYAWLDKDPNDTANVIRYLQGAIDNNGLSNNTHYQMMLQLAQLKGDAGQHAEELALVDRYLTESGSEEPTAYAMKANVLFELERFDESAKVFEDQLAKKPNDKKAMLNLASTYAQAGNDAKAGDVFDRMRKAGLMTESKDYEMAYRLLAQLDGREKEALAVINEGLEKGILTPGYDVYAFQGQVYYEAGEVAKAVASWSKAAPLSKDGEMYLNVGKLMADEDRWADAKAAAESARSKGVKKTGEVWQVISRAESGMGNKAAAVAAARESAKFPETKAWADAEIRQSSGK